MPVRAPTKIQGTGLGLSITKAIIDAHPGSINVESELGRGVRFIVTVPTRPARAKAAGEGTADRGYSFPMTIAEASVQGDIADTLDPR